MNALILSLLRVLSTPDGADGSLLSTRRKSHLIEAEWYSRLAAEGDKERREESLATLPHPHHFSIR